MAELPMLFRRAHDAIRVLDTFRRYMAGASVTRIEREANQSRSTVSGDLHAVQRLLGQSFMRQQSQSIKVDIARVAQAKRAHGKRAASVRDWHALRTTFVTLALGAGVPMELVRRVTGHTTVDIVLRHYFRPDREHFKTVLTKALPNILTGGKPVAVRWQDELAALGAKLAAGTETAQDKIRFRELASRV